MGFFRKSKPAEAPTPVTVPVRSSVFTSDAANWSGRDRANVIGALQTKITTGHTMDGIKDSWTAVDSSGVPDSQLAWYGSQSFIGHQLCAILAQHWLVGKCCSMPARDAVRKGWDLSINGDESGDRVAAIRSLDDSFNLDKALIEYANLARVFGIRVALFKVKSSDPEYYRKPFNPDGVTKGSYEGFVQIDPYWLAPMLTGKAASDPTYPGFYEPQFWTINGELVHRSHLVIYVPNTVPDILKPSYLYGGPSIPQLIYERVYAAERTANEAPMLAMAKRLDVFKTDTAQALQDQGVFEQTMGQWRTWMNNWGVKVIDKESEDITRFDTSLADFDAVIMTQYQLCAAIAGVPATKLLGTQPKGFNSTGESEEASYHEELESIQTHGLLPLLRRHYLLRQLSEGWDYSVTATFPAMDALTEKEQAEINKLKADTAVALAGIGAIDGEDERARVSADPQSGYNGLSMETIPEEPIE